MLGVWYLERYLNEKPLDCPLLLSPNIVLVAAFISAVRIGRDWHGMSLSSCLLDGLMFVIHVGSSALDEKRTPKRSLALFAWLMTWGRGSNFKLARWADLQLQDQPDFNASYRLWACPQISFKALYVDPRFLSRRNGSNSTLVFVKLSSSSLCLSRRCRSSRCSPYKQG